MLIKEILNLGYQNLKEKNIDSYHLDTELILAFILNKKREWILANPNFVLPHRSKKRFIKLINKRSKNYPIAYILGYKYFYGLKIKVNKNVLIPRPETEILVNSAIKVANNSSSILDVGTGSGAIAISLATHLKKVNIIASDISKLAINIAKKNARANNIKNIKFIKSDLLKKIDNKKINIITANLPYVASTWKHDSIKYEPRTALYSSKNGLNHYKKLLEQIKNFDFHPKHIIFEIDPSQVEDLKKLTHELFIKSKIQIKKDLNNLDRVFIINLE